MLKSPPYNAYYILTSCADYKSHNYELFFLLFKYNLNSTCSVDREFNRPTVRIITVITDLKPMNTGRGGPKIIKGKVLGRQMLAINPYDNPHYRICICRNFEPYLLSLA